MRRTWLISRLKPRTVVHPAVRWAVDRIAATGGRATIEDLATQTGFTRKHLGNLFQRQVGLSPKALARVHRFRSALALLDARMVRALGGARRAMRLLRPVASDQRVPPLHRLFTRRTRQPRPTRFRQRGPAIEMGTFPFLSIQSK